MMDGFSHYVVIIPKRSKLAVDVSSAILDFWVKEKWQILSGPNLGFCRRGARRLPMFYTFLFFLTAVLPVNGDAALAAPGWGRVPRREPQPSIHAYDCLRPTEIRTYSAKERCQPLLVLDAKPNVEVYVLQQDAIPRMRAIGK